MEKIRKHFYFSGRVQGVGFRYRSYYIAQSMGLTGWVRNLYNGGVEMEVQGKRENVELFIRNLDAGTHWIRIDSKSVADQPQLKEESGFQIRY